MGRGARVAGGQEADAKHLGRLLRYRGGQRRAEEAENEEDAAALLPRMGDLLFSSWDTWIDPGMDRFLSGEAERSASAAASSRARGAEAIGRRLHAVDTY